MDRLMVWWLLRQANPVETAYREAFQAFNAEIQSSETMSSTITTYLLRKLRIEEREVTPQELQILMRESSISQELQNKIVSSLKKEEESRYTGGSHAISKDYWCELAKEIQSQV